MGVCAMLICLQRGIVVAFILSFPDWTAFSIKWRKVDVFDVLYFSVTYLLKSDFQFGAQTVS